MQKHIYKQLKRYVSANKRTVLISILSLMLCVPAMAQVRTVSGTVKDSNGDGLPGATVIIVGTSKGVITDFDGRFSIDAENGQSLQISFVGFEPVTIEISSSADFNVVLEESTTLEEVVVIGYGETRKKDVTGAITKIETKEFNPGLISTPEQLFSGKIAGVQVTPTGGQPGASAVIAIRGVGTISGNTQPLYVVDGLLLDDVNPLPNAVTFDPLGQSPQRSPLAFINPNDIESMTILKDASATAIYGSRASNGVVVITTKSAKDIGSFLEFGSSVSLASLRGDYGVLSADQYTAIPGTTDFGGNTNWVDQIIRDQSVSESYYISFGNLTQKGDYAFSAGYENQEGLMFGSNMERVTARLNLNQEVIDDFLTANVNFQVTQLEDDIAPVGPSLQASGNLITGVISMNPTIPLTNPDGSFTQRGDLVNGVPLSEDFNNPRAIIDNYDDVAKTTRVLGNASFKAQLTEKLTGTVRLGVDRSTSNRNTSLNENYVGRAGSQNLNGIVVISSQENRNNLFEGILDYSTELGPGTFKALAGYSWQEFEIEGSYQAATNPDTINWIEQFGPGALTTLTPVSPNAINGAPSSAFGGARYTLQSYFARVNYDINGKYIFTGTVRRDGSSKFGENNKYGTFPSFAAGWILSQEDFMPAFFDYLKVRVGWGITGSQTAPPSAGKTITTFQQAGTGFQLVQVQQGNPDLKWEESNQLNVGVDFGFIDNKLRGSIDYFDKTTTDLIVPITSVAGLRYENLDAELQNSGLELVLESDIVKNGDFNLTASFNFTQYLKSEVTRYNGAVPINYGFVAAPGIQGGGSPTQRIEQGVEIGQWFLPRFGGYDEENNVFITDPQQIIDGADALPDYNFGLTIYADYKGFDFSINFMGSGGNDVLNVTSNSYLQRNRIVNQSIYNTTQDQINRFPGDISQAPPALSSQALEPGDFVRLNNLNLGYTFKADNVDWLRRLRVYFTGQNLALWSDYSGLDPEVNAGSVASQGIQVQGIDNGTFPRSKVFTFGLKASF